MSLLNFRIFDGKKNSRRHKGISRKSSHSIILCARRNSLDPTRLRVLPNSSTGGIFGYVPRLLAFEAGGFIVLESLERRPLGARQILELAISFM
jgi:hypothetical protein